MGRLKLQDLTLGYGSTAIVRDLSLEIHDGEMFALLGPSGVGKTTILKTIAGLLSPVSGTISINGQRVDHLPAEKRDVVLIFQKPLLFPFLNVGENIGFGLKMSGIRGKEAMRKIDQMMEITGLEKLHHRKIHQLSGGQQQRVALARGLVLEPSVLLLDEPLSNLDAELRLQMRELIGAIQKQTGTTMLFVTHDQSEALSISDRIGLLQCGGLRQTGTPAELFYRPLDADVARFFGCHNFISGRIQGNVFYSDPVQCPTSQDDSREAVGVIRPEDIVIHAEPADNSIKGQVTQLQFEGSATRLTIKTDLAVFTVLSLHSAVLKGQDVWLHFPPDQLHIFHPTEKP